VGQKRNGRGNTSVNKQGSSVGASGTRPRQDLEAQGGARSGLPLTRSGKAPPSPGLAPSRGLPAGPENLPPAARVPLRRKLAAPKVEVDASYSKSYVVPFRQVRIGALFFHGAVDAKQWIKRSETTATLNGAYRDAPFRPGDIVTVRRMDDVKLKDKGESWAV
jgi:hypothetical protein